MSIRRKLTALTVAALTVAGVVVGAGPASATDRVSCNSYEYLWINSNSTTCWENAGDAYVHLYMTNGASPGNNDGFVSNGTAFYRYFYRLESRTWGFTDITHIHIN